MLEEVRRFLPREAIGGTRRSGRAGHDDGDKVNDRAPPDISAEPCGQASRRFPGGKPVSPPGQRSWNASAASNSATMFSGGTFAWMLWTEANT